MYYRSFTKYLYISKETFIKTYGPIFFSWEQNSMFSCWVVKTKPIAVKYVKNMKALIAWLWGILTIMRCPSTSTVMWGYSLQYLKRYVILQLYKKIRIPRAKSTEIQFILSKKLQMYSWMWKSKGKFSICGLLKSFYWKY